MNLNSQNDRYGEATKEVVRRKPDIIIATGGERALMSAIAATDTLPIVMIAVDYDPFARGYVQNLARPADSQPDSRDLWHTLRTSISQRPQSSAASRLTAGASGS